MFKKRLAILGSTGSIGKQTLEVVRLNKEAFEVFSLTAKSNIELLREQIREFLPKKVVISNRDLAWKLNEEFQDIEVGFSEKDLCLAASHNQVDIVVAAIVGFDCLPPTIAAIEANKDIALANKECVVAAASVFQNALSKSKSRIVPIDSEQNSVYQCLNRQGSSEEIKKIYITASGGPFLNTNIEEFEFIKPQDAIRHPKWNMGVKNSLDSATLMNKGLEVIEASYIFNLPADKIEVLVHPQAIVHGMVEYFDGTVIAACFNPNMKVPIAYAINKLADESNSRTLASGVESIDFFRLKELTFIKPDTNKFKCLDLSYRALKLGKSATTIVNAANEVAVDYFLNEKIKFNDIPLVIEKTLNKIPLETIENLGDVIRIDDSARETTRGFCTKGN